LKFDPRTKIFAIAALSALAVLTPDIIFLSGGLILALELNILFGVNLLKAAKRLWFFVTAFALIALLQGVIGGITFFLRMSTVVIAAAIAISSDSREMADALIKLKFPYEIGFMVTATLGFLPMLRRELSNRIKAMAVRGIDIRRLGIFKKFRAYTYVLAPAVVGCVLKSKALADAMTARAFRAYNTRTMLRELRFGGQDVMVFLILIAYIAAFIVLTIGRSVYGGWNMQI